MPDQSLKPLRGLTVDRLVAPGVECCLSLCVFSTVLDTGPAQLFAGCREPGWLHWMWVGACKTLLTAGTAATANSCERPASADTEKTWENLLQHHYVMRVCIEFNISKSNSIYSDITSVSTSMIFHPKICLFRSCCRVREIGSQVCKIGQLAKRWLEWVRLAELACCSTAGSSAGQNSPQSGQK